MKYHTGLRVIQCSLDAGIMTGCREVKNLVLQLVKAPYYFHELGKFTSLHQEFNQVTFGLDMRKKLFTVR